MSTTINKNEIDKENIKMEKDYLNDSFYKPKFNHGSPNRDDYKFYSDTSKGKIF